MRVGRRSVEVMMLKDHMDQADGFYSPSGSREQRILVRGVETRTTGSDGPTEIAGYAALFETPATIAGQFVEVIERGAFDDTLADDVRVLFNHDPSLLLGRTASGTASISVDHDGLRYRVTPPDTGPGRDVLALVARGDVDGSSFGFRVISDHWSPGVEPGDLPVRHVERVALLDVSPVTQPAYAETTAEARSSAARCAGPSPRRVDEANLAARRAVWARNRMESSG